jgi:hypothetical protein
MSDLPPVDVVLASMILLRCRARTQGVLDAMSELRRRRVSAAVDEMKTQDDAFLKKNIVALLHNERAKLLKAISATLGEDASRMPRTIQCLAARLQWP